MTKDILNAAHRLTVETIKSLPPAGTPAPTAWFLGPKAENRAFLAKLVQQAVAAHSDFRVDYAPKDPPFATKEAMEGSAHKATCAQTEKALGDILRSLSGSTPLASYRNQSHMYWDVTLPGAVGYFAGMLFNQNNVAAEASPVTTAMEIEVARQLCRMLGYDLDGDIPPWGHITCDGSVANAEAMWAARNLAYHAVSISAALEDDARLANGRDVTVRTGGGRRIRLLDLTRWEQMNLPIAERLSLTARIIETSGLDEDVLSDALSERTIQSLGILVFHRRYLSTVRDTPVVFAPATAHYSWVKAAGLLGLGMAEVRAVPIDADGRMQLPALRRGLEEALTSHRPVAQVVAVTGTTGEGAVDPLDDIAAIRREYSERGLTFAIHADAAWGGYFASMLRPPRTNAPDDPSQTFGFDPAPQEALGDHAARHLGAMARADTITVDPHKAGFIPYPAGCLSYRDHRLPDLISVKSPVVYHDGAAPTVGVYGIEGSRPGAAAVAVLLSHTVIPPDASGYGRLLGRCVFGAKRFYAATVTLGDAKTPYTITPLIRLPAEVDGKTAIEVDAQRRLIRDKLVPPENDRLMALFREEPDLKTLFRRLGPDLTVFAYAANFRTGSGTNTDIGLMNELNDLIYHRLSLESDEGKRPPDRPMFVTASAYDPCVTGQDFVDAFAQRAGLKAAPGVPLRFLISTMQNPWITATSQGSMIPELMRVLDRTLREAVAEVIDRHGL